MRPTGSCRTNLERTDSHEYRRLEAHAEKMACEIEGSDTYKKNLDLENGDGDEEMLYSAVHRASPQQQQQAPNERYLPPHIRIKQSRPVRNGPPQLNHSSGPQARPATVTPPSGPPHATVSAAVPHQDAGQAPPRKAEDGRGRADGSHELREAPTSPLANSAKHVVPEVKKGPPSNAKREWPCVLLC